MLTFLFVDDDDNVQDLHRMTIERSGLPINMVEATNGLEAIQLLKNFDVPPAVVLLDINMPRMGGFGFLETIDPEVIKDIPVIMLTGSFESADRIKTMEFPAVTDYVVKPLNVTEIAELYERLLPENNSIHEDSNTSDSKADDS